MSEPLWRLVVSLWLVLTSYQVRRIIRDQNEVTNRLTLILGLLHDLRYKISEEKKIPNP